MVSKEILHAGVRLLALNFNREATPDLFDLFRLGVGQNCNDAEWQETVRRVLVTEEKFFPTVATVLAFLDEVQDEWRRKEREAKRLAALAAEVGTAQ